MNSVNVRNISEVGVEGSKGICACEKDLGAFVSELAVRGVFGEDDDRDGECETDSAQSSGCSSLVTSGSDGMDAVPASAHEEKMEEDKEPSKNTPKKRCVRWDDTVSVRTCESVDTVAKLKNAAAVRPTIESVTFDEEEAAIRSKLVGLIPAGKRRHHDYGRMYGCGPCLTRTESYLDEDSDDSAEDDEYDDEVIEPVRVIHASAPSEMWFSAGLM